MEVGVALSWPDLAIVLLPATENCGRWLRWPGYLAISLVGNSQGSSPAFCLLHQASLHSVAYAVAQIDVKAPWLNKERFVTR